jgi:3',5'-cyclic AMP phosphodiesterase CpdA
MLKVIVARAGFKSIVDTASDQDPVLDPEPDPVSAAGGGARTSGNNGSEIPAANPVHWQEVHDVDGKSYYWNTDTNVTQYEEPKGELVARVNGDEDGKEAVF